MKQQFELYTTEDGHVWNLLFSRQKEHLSKYGCSAYCTALEEMKSVLNEHELPNFDTINQWFSYRTGWQIECVPGLIDVTHFFQLLAQKKFPSSTWLRSLEKLDYLEEPDMFHDIFGHIPLLSNPEFSDFMVEFGKLGNHFSENNDVIIELQRLYWYTVEFGLFKENNELKVFGAGIISSFQETTSSLTQEKVTRTPFDWDKIRSTAFKTDEIQRLYFIIENMNQLKISIHELQQQLTHEMA